MSFKTVYRTLYRHYGPQHWWPGETPFEVMVGAVLTQNTAWSNVEKAIANLKRAKALDPHAIMRLPHARLARLLQPSGYFNIKAKRLCNFCAWYLAQGGYEVLARLATPVLRKRLLAVNGVGPETADDILLYAFERPVFVIDAYTRRLHSRLGYVRGDEDYETLRALFEKGWHGKGRIGLFNEFHALIVRHTKEVCRPRPRCALCCLGKICPTGVQY